MYIYIYIYIYTRVPSCKCTTDGSTSMKCQRKSTSLLSKEKFQLKFRSNGETKWFAMPVMSIRPVPSYIQ